MIPETKTIPRLVDPGNFKITAPPVKVKKWNLNKILLVLFILFMVFFLFSCKYGMFKNIQNEPIPYTIIQHS
jgi:hypothetical protein